ncbi:hypothetical protein V1525DRAFT_422593 [Lipomyces kononenkoae]|uniref:Uncharacterized protein n=1 Tax=Lipomyces kononenkoae TaxID=34357 RepID=A0ACC3SQZ6_LIPKO
MQDRSLFQKNADERLERLQRGHNKETDDIQAQGSQSARSQSDSADDQITCTARFGLDAINSDYSQVEPQELLGVQLNSGTITDLISQYTLLSETLLRSIRSVYVIQSLLLLCLWPFPIKNQIHDPSWNYCGIAVAAALQMGLHQTEANWEYGFRDLSSVDLDIRLTTWLGCFLVSAYLSSDLGLPPLIDAATGIGNVALKRAQSISDQFAMQVEVQLRVARQNAILSKRFEPLIQSSFIQLFDRDLDAIRSESLPSTFAMVEVNFLAAKLNLYGISLLSGTRVDIGGRVDASWKIIWYMGLRTAIRLAHIFTKSSKAASMTNFDESVHQLSDIVTVFYPKRYFRILATAGFYMLKFLFVDGEVTASEKAAARNNVKLIYETLLNWSSHDCDEYARTAKVIAVLCNAEMQGQPPVAKTTHSRLGASLIYDALEMVIRIRRGKENFKGQIATEQITAPVDLETARGRSQGQGKHSFNDRPATEQGTTALDLETSVGGLPMSSDSTTFLELLGPMLDNWLPDLDKFAFP